MFEFDNLWICFGLLALLFILINIIKLVTKKRNNWSLFCIASLSFVSLAILSDYHQVLNAVNRNDVSYILDVIPYLKSFITPPTFFGVFVNLIICILNTILDKK